MRSCTESRGPMWRCEALWYSGLIELLTSVFDVRTSSRMGSSLSRWLRPDYNTIKWSNSQQTIASETQLQHKPQVSTNKISSLFITIFGVIIKTFWFFRIFLIYYKKIFLKPEDLKRKYFELFKSFISFQQTELWSNYTNFKELQFSSRHFHTGLVQ